MADKKTKMLEKQIAGLEKGNVFMKDQMDKAILEATKNENLVLRGLMREQEMKKQLEAGVSLTFEEGVYKGIAEKMLDVIKEGKKEKAAMYALRINGAGAVYVDFVKPEEMKNDD